MANKKMIYILNHYAADSAQHFFHVVNLLAAMARKGVEVVLVIEKCEGMPEINEPRLKVVAQKESARLRRAAELKRILRTYLLEGYDRVFVRISLPAALIAIRQAKKYDASVFFWQSGDNLTYDRQKRGMDKLKYYLTNYWMLLYIKNHVNHFVTGPETMVRYYQKELNIKPEKMTLLYNDIDLQRFSASTREEKLSLRKQYGIDADKRVILFVHRLTPVKRFYLQLPYVIEKAEFRDLNVLLIIAGTGPDFERVKKQVEQSEYGDLVRLAGSVPNREVMNYYKMSDLFINPSYSEGFPRVVIEAMACALPVVATDVGGTKDIVGDLQGRYIIDKDDRDGFRNAVYELLSDNSLYSQIKEENLKTVVRFSTENVADMYIDKIFTDKERWQ